MGVKPREGYHLNCLTTQGFINTTIIVCPMTNQIVIIWHKLDHFKKFLNETLL